MATPPKSKIAQMRAEHRKRQRRITFLSQLPGVFGVFVFAAAQLRHNFSQEVTGAAVVFFIALAGISWVIARAAKKAPDPYGFNDDGFSGDGVCPDCGAKETLEYHIDEKKHRMKRFVGFCVSLGFPVFFWAIYLLLILFYLIFGDATGRGGALENAYWFFMVLSVLPVVFFFLSPVIVSLDQLNMPRFEVCRACGRSEPVPFDKTSYQKDFFFTVIERFWARFWKYKWRIIFLMLFVPIAAIVAYASQQGDTYKKETNVIELVLIMSGGGAMCLAFWFYLTAFSANRFYDNFFGLKKIEEEKPDNKTVVQTPDAVAHHP